MKATELERIRKIPAPIKVKSALPPPKKKPEITPPPLNEEFYGHGVFLQKERIFPGAHRTISGPGIAGKKFYGHEDFSERSLFRSASIRKRPLIVP